MTESVDPTRPSQQAELAELRRRLDVLERMARGYRWDPSTGDVTFDGQIVTPGGINPDQDVRQATDLPSTYPVGVSINRNAAAAQGWPLNTGERAVVVTIRGTETTVQHLHGTVTRATRAAGDGADAWGAWGGQTGPSASQVLRRNSTQAFTASTWTKINWNIDLVNARYGTPAAVSRPWGANTDLVCPLSGFYQLNAWVEFYGGGSRAIATIGYGSASSPPDAGTDQIARWDSDLSGDQMVTVSGGAYINAGEIINVWGWTNAASGGVDAASKFSIIRSTDRNP